MKVQSLNLGEKKTVSWRGKPVETGIFKFPVEGLLTLESTDVAGDVVVDRRYHGGIDKACYLYSANHYPFWEELFPDLDFSPGMFGENITVEGLDESKIQIGDIYRMGSALVQVSQPRQPCFKLGIRFNSQTVLKHFINSPYPGVYVRVLENGQVNTNDDVQLVERLHNSIGLLEVWNLLYNPNPDMELLEFAVDFQHLADACRQSLRQRLSR